MNIYGDGRFYNNFIESDNFSTSIKSGYVFSFTYFGCFRKSLGTWWHVSQNSSGTYLLRFDDKTLYENYLNLFLN